MRFLPTGSWKQSHYIRAILACFLFYTAMLWLSSGMLYFQKMSLDPSSVVAHYLGDEATYRSPQSLEGMLETLHIHAFALGMLLLTLTHLVLFAPLSLRFKSLGIAVPFLSGIGELLSGFAVRFIHPAFAIVKVVSFLALEGSLFLLMCVIGYSLLKPYDHRHGSAHK